MLSKLTCEEVCVLVKAKPYSAIHIDADWDRCRDEVQAELVSVMDDFEVEVAFGYVDCDEEGEYAKEIGLGNVPSIAYYRGEELVAVVVGAARREDVVRNIRVLMAGGVPGNRSARDSMMLLPIKYAVAFFLFAVLLSWYATQEGGGWHALHWLAANCLMVSVGYAGFGAGVFMKGVGGVIPWSVKLFYLPMLVYMHVVWWVCLKLSTEAAFNVVNDGLVIGRRLGVGEAPEGIECWVDLTAEFEDPAEVRGGAGYVCFPVLDAGVPDVGVLRGVVRKLGSRKMYVHCAQGHGRTGVFALAVLAERGLIESYEEGVAILKAARPGVGLNRLQERFAREYVGEVLGERERERE